MGRAAFCRLPPDGAGVSSAPHLVPLVASLGQESLGSRSRPHKVNGDEVGGLKAALNRLPAVSQGSGIGRRGGLGAFGAVTQPSRGEQSRPGIRPQVLTAQRKGLDLGRGPHPQRALGHLPVLGKTREAPCATLEASVCFLPPGTWDVDGAGGCRFDRLYGNMGGSGQGSVRRNTRGKAKTLTGSEAAGLVPARTHSSRHRGTFLGAGVPTGSGKAQEPPSLEATQILPPRGT